jgi:hypothetical protein
VMLYSGGPNLRNYKLQITNKLQIQNSKRKT